MVILLCRMREMIAMLSQKWSKYLQYNWKTGQGQRNCKFSVRTKRNETAQNITTIICCKEEKQGILPRMSMPNPMMKKTPVKTWVFWPSWAFSRSRSAKVIVSAIGPHRSQLRNSSFPPFLGTRTWKNLVMIWDKSRFTVSQTCSSKVSFKDHNKGIKSQNKHEIIAVLLKGRSLRFPISASTTKRQSISKYNYYASLLCLMNRLAKTKHFQNGPARQNNVIKELNKANMYNLIKTKKQ